MTNKKYLLIKIITVFLLVNSTLSGDILSNYRLNGIENIEKQMDANLMKKDYWDKYLNNVNTTFGYIESYSNILVCDKSLATLTLYIKDVNGSYNLKRKYSAFTGEIKGDKVKEGDLKTPIGIYDITKKISKVDSFYGPMAFVTSYPNIYDKYRGKNGSGIWIHGLPTKQVRDEYTKGCIAINNQNIECLDRNIDIKQTLLLINEKEISQNVSKNTLANILAQLYEWRYAWLYNDIKSYLHFYDESFIRYDGMNSQKFKTYKTRIFNKKESKKIIFYKINIIPYPNTDNMYKITFLEKYQSDSFTFTGNKVLIVKLTDSQIKIITEK
ncbi:L,D-transpeptidase family protein [Sulfurimonas sp.]|jgi:murein L,D-transpeptidase YafK|uniref:L,D-transpeptidase family protein n=1 Tax=Sulfurimonas sp. TaxID=2022749 RepID=UPI0026010F4E|nr:L,D-transpeptidase family protein [Sulfurimonas sp.]